MPSIHNQRFCLSKNRFWQDELKDRKIACPGCKKMIDAEDVFDTTQLIDLVSLIKVDPKSTFKWPL